MFSKRQAEEEPGRVLDRAFASVEAKGQGFYNKLNEHLFSNVSISGHLPYKRMCTSCSCSQQAGLANQRFSNL